MDPPSRSFNWKLAERVIWTAVQAALGVVTVEMFDLPPVLAPVFATVLAVVKGYVARRIGDPNEPATLPAGV
jgi:hypothetical protein